jgi:hypothetical protein
VTTRQCPVFAPRRRRRLPGHRAALQVPSAALASPSLCRGFGTSDARAHALAVSRSGPTPCPHTRSPQPRPRVPQRMAKDPVVMPVSLCRCNSSPCFFQLKQATRWSSFFSLLASARPKLQNRASTSSPIEPLRLLPFAPPDYQNPSPLPFFLPVEQINKLQVATLLALHELSFATSLRSSVARTINLLSFPIL